uniref:Uncharacterized protein n=1 Tax=viral metagenome TaxID=1070528 RepID=A0A6M3L5G8_9ZZZZ
MPEITEAELYAEIDKFAQGKIKTQLTDLQFNTINYARENNVSWAIIEIHILKKINLDNTSINTIKTRYYDMKRKRNL